MGLKPMTKANEGGKGNGSLKPKNKAVSGIKLGTSIKTATVEKMNANFVSWDDLLNKQALVFELNGEYKTTVSPKNKNHKFTNYYVSKAVIVDADDNVIKIIEDENGENEIQIPCQQSHRQGIDDLIEMDETVCIFRDMATNTKDGNTYYNCNIGSLDLENLDAFEN